MIIFSFKPHHHTFVCVCHLIESSNISQSSPFWTWIYATSIMELEDTDDDDDDDQLMPRQQQNFWGNNKQSNSISFTLKPFGLVVVVVNR